MTADPTPSPPARRKWTRWSKRSKAEFLGHLAATCNVSAAVAATGLNPVTLYSLRRKDPEFLAEWNQALDCGYQLLETRLVGHALAGEAKEGCLSDSDAAMPPVSVELALRLLQTRRAALAGKVRQGRPRYSSATKEETDAAILKKLAAIRAARKKQG